MILPSGVILNNDIFINTSHVVKMEKNIVKPETNSVTTVVKYTVEIYMLGYDLPIILNFDKENDRDVIFNKIVMELYGHNYTYLNF